MTGARSWMLDEKQVPEVLREWVKKKKALIIWGFVSEEQEFKFGVLKLCSAFEPCSVLREFLNLAGWVTRRPFHTS